MTTPQPPTDLIERLRAAGGPRIEWQVVNTETEGIVIWFGSGYPNPEHHAREWLEAHKQSHRMHEVRRVECPSICDEAADAIAQLEADRDSWERQASDRVDDAVRFAQEADVLRATVAQFEADAARYRWLRGNYMTLMCSHSGMSPRVEFMEPLRHSDFTPAMLDAAIARRMGKEGAQP